MDVRLKERLIGALVVVAVAVLVLPWILDDDKGEGEFSSKIPPAPPAPAARAVDLSQPRPLDEATFDDSIIAAETTVTATETLPTATGGQAGANPLALSPAAQAGAESAIRKPERPAAIEAGFVIQLGTFSNRDNAERLVQTLRQHKFAAYSKVDNRADPAVIRVLVGPMTKREQADAQLARVRTLSGQNAIVVAYDPLKH
ncbi:MAG: SPOR domain-containing protein [Permianibacter sp.]